MSEGMKMDAEREAFERWYLNSRGLPYPCDGTEISLDEEGAYYFHSPAAAWRSWQARARLPVDGVVVPREQQELEWLENWLRFAAEPIGQECCNRPGQECCGCPDPIYPDIEDVGSAMNDRLQELRALLAQHEGVKP